LDLLLGIAVERGRATTHIQGCRVLETMSMEIFASNGWSFNNKIGFT
jgi:hypothetical protein